MKQHIFVLLCILTCSSDYLFYYFQHYHFFDGLGFQKLEDSLDYKFFLKINPFESTKKEEKDLLFIYTLYIANQTVEQLSNLKEIIKKMSFNQISKFELVSFLDSCGVRLENEPLELDAIKLELIIKMQQKIIKEFTSGQVDYESRLETEVTILNMFSELQQKIPINEKTVNLRVVITLMDYKIHLWIKEEPKLCIEDLLSAIDETNLWSLYSQSKNTYVIFVYFSLIYEYLSIQEANFALPVMSQLITILIKHLQLIPEPQKLSPKYIQLGIMLLIVQLSFKCIKKHFSSGFQLNNQSKIYILLYQLDHSVIQEMTFIFRKQFNKTREEALTFVRKKIIEMLIKYDEKTIDQQCSLIKYDKKVEFKIKKSLSVEALNRRKSIAPLKLKDGSKKILQSKLELKIQKNMFISKVAKKDVFLERKLRFRTEKMNNQKPINRLSLVEKNLKLEKDKKRSISGCSDNDSNNPKKRSISYEACKKVSLNRNFELELMICQRANSFNLSLNTPNNQNRESQRFYRDSIRKKHKGNKKNSIRFNSNQNGTSQQKCRNPSAYEIDIPPTINKTLQQYLLSYRDSLFYQLKIKGLPLYLYFSQLNQNMFYYLKGHILKFIRIQIYSLMATITYSTNRNENIYLQNLNLLEQSQSKIKQLFLKQKQENKIFGFFFMGKIISFFAVRIQTSEHRKLQKFKVVSIQNDSQIYTHKALINSDSFQRYHIKNILKAEQQLIHRINRSIQVNFDYHIPITIDFCQMNKIHQFRLWQFLRPDSKTNLILKDVYQVKLSCRWERKIKIVDVQIKKNIQTGVFYLIWQLSFEQECWILPFFKINLDSILPKLQIKQKMIKLVQSQQINQKSWSDVFLSQKIFRFPSKRFISRSRSKKFMITTSTTLIERGIVMISGEQNQKWFFFVILSDFTPAFISHLHHDSKRELAKKIKRKSTAYPSHSNRSLPQSKDQMVELWRKQEIRNIKIEGQSAIMDQKKHKIHFYQYRWIIFVKKMFYHCFYNQHQIFVVKIRNKQFLYFSKYRVNPQLKDKHYIYREFRSKVIEELKTYKMVIEEWKMIITLSVGNEGLICKVNNIQAQNEIIIKAEDFSSFNIGSFQFDYTFFSNKQYMRRTRSLFKIKYLQLMEKKS